MMRNCGVVIKLLMGTSAERRRIHRDGVDDRAVIYFLPLSIEGKRSPVIERTARAAFEFVEQKRRFSGGVRVARIPAIRIEVVIHLPVPGVGTRLGEDLDAADAELVVFRRETDSG